MTKPWPEEFFGWLPGLVTSVHNSIAQDSIHNNYILKNYLNPPICFMLPCSMFNKTVNIYHNIVKNFTLFVLWLDLGYTVKYSLMSLGVPSGKRLLFFCGFLLILVDHVRKIDTDHNSLTLRGYIWPKSPHLVIIWIQDRTVHLLNNLQYCTLLYLDVTLSSYTTQFKFMDNVVDINVMFCYITAM